ncbi:fluoride efflux transporter CrcB [bacterium]|nr:fluoride efflux transporter CrcB [bacterium]
MAGAPPVSAHPDSPSRDVAPTPETTPARGASAPAAGARPPGSLVRYGAVALGGVLGALLRHGHGALVHATVPGEFPLGTFTINLAGTLALAAFLAALLETAGAHPLWRPFFAVGLCGAYTTFSSYESEILGLVQRGRLDVAVAYASLSVVLGLLAAYGAARLVRRTRRGRGRLLVAPPLFLAPVIAGVAALVVVLALDRIQHLSPRTLAVGCLAVAAGGSLGAVSRYAVGAWVSSALPAFFPWGTLVINVTGSFLIGFFEGAAKAHPGAPALLRPLLVTGWLGGYTTFSTFSYETTQLLEERSRKRAAANVLASVLGGFAAVLVGYRLGSLT